MANVQHGSESMQGPLSAAAYSSLCDERTWHSRRIPIHVQYRKAGLVDCARVVEVKPGRDGLDFFRLEAGGSPFWASHHNVSACAGNGFCFCEAEADASASASAVAAALAATVPLGNTGTTTEAGA